MNNIKRDFGLFARDHGVSSSKLSDYSKTVDYYLTPNVIEERSMNVTSIDVFSRLLIDRQLFLGTEINDDVANILVAQLLWLEQNGDTDIQMLINSPGGSVSAGWAIVDCMDFIKPEISTIVVGSACSMASVIACNGNKGKRYILPHSRFMIHQPLSGVAPHTQASDIIISAEQIKICRDELYELLSKNSNLTIEEIAKMADRDYWMRADEAIKHGFIDEVIKKK